MFPEKSPIPRLARSLSRGNILLATAILLGFAVPTLSSHAQSVIDEPADYSVGNLHGTPATGTGIGLTGNWTTGANVDIATDSNTYGLLQPAPLRTVNIQPLNLATFNAHRSP